MPLPVVLLMGATATGKTAMAMQLADRFACDLISVDSAMVYRGMNVGTAKPDVETLAKYPHALVDIRDPENAYSVGDFVRDATREIARSHARNRMPVLVGGTMMYFRALISGIADLPEADHDVRRQIDAEAAVSGWPAMHQALLAVDPLSAERLQPLDKQRIQRALEVYRLTGTPLSTWQRRSKDNAPGENFVQFALTIEPRALLHKRILQRLDSMIEAGFADEVAALRQRAGLSADSASMRAVGYRQFWQLLEGTLSQPEARDRTLFATRQLAKRQLTWLRSMDDVTSLDALEGNAFDTILMRLKENTSENACRT